MHRLQATIPAPRLAPYVAACDGTGVHPMALYRWASRVSLAMFDELSILEVAMRSAMARELSQQYGLGWYDNTSLLDWPTRQLVTKAWESGKLESLRTAGVAPEVIHGKLVATLMFGFWVKVLGRGGYYGKPPHRQRRIYDELLWKPALRNAFPNVGPFERQRVEQCARLVNKLRNRVAHHEHIIWGIPDNDTGIRHALGATRANLLELAGFIDGDLRGWYVDHSELPARLGECPLPTTASLNL